MAIIALGARGSLGQSHSVSTTPTGITSLGNRGYTSSLTTSYTSPLTHSYTQSQSKTQNNGGILGGLGYLAEKLAVGFVSSLEGITDYTASGLAKLFGADDWAEEIIANDWFGDWYSHPEEWYNPGKGWQVAGDVAGGIGTSLPAMLGAVAAGVATGGAAAPAAVSFLVSGLGAAGRGTKEAYEQTGQLTGKEFGYGALTGLTEGGMEAVSNLIGVGTGAIVKSFSKAIGKETAEAFAKQGILKTLGKEFLGEAFEESMSEILAPQWKRLTYDPNAQNATADEIIYAGLVGGLSGMVMGGAGYGFDTITSYARGNKLVNSGGVDSVLNSAGDFSEYETKYQTDDDLMKEIVTRRNSLIESLRTTGGQITTAEQKRSLGALWKANYAASTKMFVAKRAMNIVNNADLIAERLTAYGYKTAEGKPITFTAAELTEGYNPNKPSSIYKALKSNDKLRSLAISDATGQIMMDTAKFTQATLTGKKLASQVDLNRFVETATPQEVAAVSKALGIESWASLTPDLLAERITEYLNNGGVQRATQTNELKQRLKDLPVSNSQKIPKIINLASDGARRYSDGALDIAVERQGDTYTMYNYQTGDLTRGLTRAEINSFLREYSTNKDKVLSEALAEVESARKMQAEIAAIEELAKSEIKEYSKLNAPNQSMIRRIIRAGKESGLSESDALLYAKIAAHSGLNIEFNKEATSVTNEDGTTGYADGFYDAAQNTIVVNPEGKRTAERLLLHELDHAIRKYYTKNGERRIKVFKHALEGVDPETIEKIKNEYKKTTPESDLEAVTKDEINAYYAEKVLSNKKTLEKLLEAEPSLKEKILSFFKGASIDYADTPELSAAAKRYYRTYKKLFDQFAARNAQNNAMEPFTNKNGSNVNENGVSDNVRTINGNNMSVSDRRYAIGTENKTRITAEMSDSERASVLRNRTLTVPIYKGQADSAIEDVKRNYEREKKAFGKKAVVEIAEKLGIIHKSINFEDVDVKIELSNRNLKESITKEATPEQVSKLLPILSATARSAIAIERHDNRYYHDSDTVYFDNLVGAYIDEENVVPVRFGLKHSRTGKTTLYVVVDQNKIPVEKLTEIKTTEVIATNGPDKSATEDHLNSVAYSISQILSFVNSKDLLRYIPDDFLGSDRRDVKKKAIAETQEYTYEKNDKKYSDFVKQGNLRAAKDMLAAKAKTMGYTSDLSYQGSLAFNGAAPSSNAYFLTKEERIEAFERGDFEGDYSLGDFVDNGLDGHDLEWQLNNPIAASGRDRATLASLRNLSSVIRQGKRTIRMYRAVDSKIKENSFRNGDWVTPSKEYAERHIELQTWDSGRIIEQEVSIDDIWWNGDDINEWGYDNGDTSELYSNTPNNVKTSEITYDDEGRLIPISKRYDSSSSDKRYALDIEGEDITGAEVMSWAKKSEGDGKLDLEATVARGLPYKRGKSNLTVGELRKIIANSTKEKVYSKADALQAVNKLSGTWGLTVKARDEIADTIWQFLNEAPDIERRQDMAHDMAEYIVAKVLMDSKTENPDAIEAAEKLTYLRTGIGKLSFSDEDIAELRHAADEKGLKKLIGRWGWKGEKRAEGTSGGYIGTRRIPMDIFVTNIAREMPGMDYLEQMHPAEAFLEIDRTYSQAYTDSKDKWISRYWDMEDSEIPSMIKDVEDGILSAYNNFGEKSKFKKLVDDKIEKYQNRADKYKAERNEIKGYDRVIGLLMNQATKMKNLKMGTYANATQHDSDVLRSSVERLASIQFRGNLNVTGTRNIISELRLWYTPNNSMLDYVDDQNPGYYDKGVANLLDVLADGDGKLTKEELLMLYDVMSYFTNFVEIYGKVWRKGQWVDADVEAKRYVNTLQTNLALKVGPIAKLLGSRYMQTFGDPMTVARRMDMYESGFFTEMLEEIREGAMGAQIAEMEIMSEYDDFLVKNKKYIEKTNAEKVVYHGASVPKMQLIGLYMTLKRKHSRPGLALNGFSFVDNDGQKVRVNGFAIDTKDITEPEINKRSEEQLALIDQKLTDTDREYIKILEHAYNVEARKLKADRDIQRRGFTNAGMGYYYPIRRGNIAKNIDSADYMAEMDRVSNSSFNKNTVKGARQELYIENADVVFRRHIRAVTQYAYLSPAIEAYNRLYNLDVGGNPNQPISVATESANVWDKGNAYFKKLISDVQGIPAMAGEGSEILSKIRSNYAKYQLSANPKVWFTQLSSLFASTSMLDADSIIKGASISAEGVDKYAPLAKLRNSENTAAIAQAVLDTRGKKVASGISKVGDVLIAPIGKMDRFVIGRLFAASQVQIEKNGGAKIGTEENKIAAGELLTKVILETQQNSIATERSAAMRSGSEFMRAVTMFTSDSMKVGGRVLDSYGKALALKARIKAETDADKRATLEKRLGEANKQFGKSMGALLGSAVYMACVAQLFRHIYNKDEEDKSTAEVMINDVIGNLMGGFPIFKDVYAKLVDGYDVSNYTYSAINDILNSVINVGDAVSAYLNGDLGAEEKNRAIRNLINAIGQASGLPTRNIYNVTYGLIKRFSPTTAFSIDSMFYEKNYQSELNKAIERGDTKMTSYLFGLMIGEKLDSDMDSRVFDELLTLTKAGYKVLPKSMPDSIMIGDVEYILTDAERAAMQKIYSQYDDAVKSLISSSAYASMTDDDKVLAINYISDLYYNKANAEVLGTDAKKTTKLIDVLGADVLAKYYIATRGIESDVDRTGKTIAGSKRAKVVKAISGLGVTTEQKLLLICASGYTLKDGDIRGVSADAAKSRLLRYILRLKDLTADEKAAIAEMCGFEVKNGRIINNLSKKS